MRDIATLLFGTGPDSVFPEEGARSGELAAEAREWCQTPPDHAALERLALTFRANRAHPFRPARGDGR
jgi:hypothetical protein